MGAIDYVPSYPACYDTSTVGAGYNSVISVTAIDTTGARPSWANRVTAVALGTGSAVKAVGAAGGANGGNKRFGMSKLPSWDLHPT